MECNSSRKLFCLFINCTESFCGLFSLVVSGFGVSLCLAEDFFQFSAQK